MPGPATPTPADCPTPGCALPDGHGGPGCLVAGRMLARADAAPFLVLQGAVWVRGQRHEALLFAQLGVGKALGLLLDHGHTLGRLGDIEVALVKTPTPRPNPPKPPLTPACPGPKPSGGS